jgi:hypothetical protein
MRAQQLELIYSQSGMIYESLPDTPQSTFNKNKQKFEPHSDDIVGSSRNKSTYQLSNQLQQLLIQQTVANQTPSSPAPLTQTSDVHSLQSTNPKGNQQTEGNRKHKKIRVRGI